MKNERVDVFRLPSGEITIRSHTDLLKAGISVHPNYVAERWGAEAAINYQKVIAQRIRRGPNRQVPE